MLQRVFLPRRYSSRVICSAYDAFRARNRNLWANAADVTGQGGKSAGASVSLLDKKTSIPELSQLVLQLCEGTARQRFGGAGAAVLGAPSLTPFPFSPQRAGQHHQQQLQQGEQELRWRKQYLQYLGDSFSEFLGVCEASSHKVEALNAGCSTVCGVRSGRDGLIVKALRNGDIAVVSALTTMEAVLSEGNLLPLHSEALLSATSMLSLIEERFVADDALRHDLLELDCLLVKFLQTGDISSEASVEWIPHYFASLTPGLRGLLPQLLDLIQEEGGNGEFSSYDALVQLCALPHAGKGNSQDLLSSGGDAFDELLRQSSAALEGTAGAGVGADATASPSSIGAQDILCQQALRAIRQSLLRSKLALALLALVVEAGQPLLHTETYSAIRDKCIPAVSLCNNFNVRTIVILMTFLFLQITHNVLHLSMLLWLDSLRPTDNHMLVQEVELAAIFPLSAAFTGAGTAVAGKVKVESSKPDSNASVFENFMRTLRNRTSLSRVFSSAQLSTHSELSGFLFRSGQYVSLSRWAALTQLVLAPSAADSLSDGGGGVHPHGTEQLLTCIGRCRAHITRLTAEYLELLRCQWYHLQRVPLSTAGSPTGPLAAIKQKMHDLLTATTELDTLADSVLSNVLLTGDATLSPMAGDRRRSLHGADVARGMVQHLKTLWFDSVTRMRSANFACSLCQSKRVHNRLEGLLALADAVMYVGTVGKGSTLLALLADSSLPGQDAEGAAKELLDNRLSELCRTLHLSTVSGVLEMLDRALFFLPRKEGSALAMEGALLLAEHVAATLDAVTQRSGLDRQACSQVLLTELHGAWSRVFEYALLHGERYTEALDALMRVAELEEQRVLDADALSSTTSSSFSAPAAVVPWRGCLRTLVAQACDMGKLGWLCSIPDRQLQGFAKQGFSLCAVIASTLEELAVTLDTPSAMNFNEANYFECLFVFHLSRRNYHDAARVMHKLLERKSITGPSSAELEAQVG